MTFWLIGSTAETAFGSGDLWQLYLDPTYAQQAGQARIGVLYRSDTCGARAKFNHMYYTYTCSTCIGTGPAVSPGSDAWLPGVGGSSTSVHLKAGFHAASDPAVRGRIAVATHGKVVVGE